ncbi:hypothetical protein [Alicyclobacillus fastidiosus]|uniref:Uncharacterized protein n=1 Tax=Alicyclobacillus fastidiosus TaxID=392011 RepID=A0ABV5ACM7_9BACL|nr:hypothetical protein [Alicyclobacillus fastidiosus]WEH11357.1 hypothetical protein PYS47_09145 [Alicyclobacillus fastidiosus]
MEKYRFSAAVADPSVWEYPTQTTVKARSLVEALDRLARRFQLTLEDVGRRTVTFATMDGALIEYDIS